MASLPDDRGLAALSIPGTHDSGARFEPLEGLAQTQTLTIGEQLDAGVRFFDVRCRNFQDEFLIFHGAIDQNQTFDEVLATMFAFLDAHPGETVIASIKEEGDAFEATQSFEDVFAGYVAEAPERWVLAPTLPALGDVRGKIVLLRRFEAAAAPLGIDAVAWPDNLTFTIDGPDARLRVQDEFIVTDNDAKLAAVTALLDETAADDGTTLSLDFTSGFQMIDGLPNIRVVSDDLNARLDTLLADPARAGAHLGVVVMDFATAARAAAIIATND